MYDHGLKVLEQYGLTAKSVTKGRGALLCDTEEGLKSIREYWGSPSKIESQRKLLEKCRENGFPLVDQILRNQEGEIVTIGEDGVPYVVRDWYRGRECDTRSREDIQKSVEAMARLHKVLKMEQEEITENNLLEECKKHNRELHRIRKYVQTKKKKSAFEECMASSIEMFLEQGEKVVEELEQSGYKELLAEKRYEICHGECSQHNILFTKAGIAFVNFEHWKPELQTGDLCQFMRKILEKNYWDFSMGVEMLQAYKKQRSLSKEEILNLKLQLAYPWKYWKLANFYTNSNKVWISRKNLEKLEQTISLAEPWKNFLKECWSSSIFS